MDSVDGRRIGLSPKAERVFEKTSNAFLVLLGCAWALSLATARVTGDKVNIVAPASAAEASHSRSPQTQTMTYLASAMGPDAVARLESFVTGKSGKLRAEIRGEGEQPGIVRAEIATDALGDLTEFSLITLRSARDIRRGRLGLYYLGSWPPLRFAKGGAVAYKPPSGFIEVTKGNEDTKLSDHFRIRDFLTHDQANVWPKYVAVNMNLVDKLELVLGDLRDHGINPEGVRVMSGFRTPQYNRSGGNPGGRAGLSRHMYGDAADIYIDNGGTGQMSDLNHDGRVNIGDARVILAAVDRVERSHPSLVGGAGVYVGNGAHGPFVHIDARGYAARWTGTGD